MGPDRSLESQWKRRVSGVVSPPRVLPRRYRTAPIVDADSSPELNPGACKLAVESRWLSWMDRAKERKMSTRLRLQLESDVASTMCGDQPVDDRPGNAYPLLAERRPLDAVGIEAGYDVGAPWTKVVSLPVERQNLRSVSARSKAQTLPSSGIRTGRCLPFHKPPASRTW